MVLEYGSSIWDLLTTKDIIALKTFKERHPDLPKMSSYSLNTTFVTHLLENPNWKYIAEPAKRPLVYGQKAINYNLFIIIWSNIWQIAKMRIWILPGLCGLRYRFLSLFYSEFLLKSLHYAKFTLLMFLILSLFSITLS